MKLAIMQPYLFPYLGYFQLINAVDKFILYDDVNFIKHGWINRNRILIAGNVGYMTIPLKNASSFLPINEVMIQNEPGLWRAKLIKTMRQSYGKAAHFHEIFPIFEAILSQQTGYIAEIAAQSIIAVCQYLDIRTPIIECSKEHSDTRHLHAEQRVIKICQKEQAQTYINPIGGKELYAGDHFRSNNIQLNFIQPNEIHYSQSTREFHPWLSIIDVLMHNSKEKTQHYLLEYALT